MKYFQEASGGGEWCDIRQICGALCKNPSEESKEGYGPKRKVQYAVLMGGYRLHGCHRIFSSLHPFFEGLFVCPAPAPTPSTPPLPFAFLCRPRRRPR